MSTTRTTVLLMTICCVAAVDARAGCNTKRKKVAVRAESGTDRLSPEFAALMHGGGKLAGITNDGRAILELNERESKCVRASDQFTEFSVQDDVSTEAATQERLELMLSYERAKKPDAATLKKANLDLIEDYEPGCFMIVSPKGQLTAQSVGTLLDSKEIKFVQPSYKIEIPPGEHVAKMDVAPMSISPLAAGGSDAALGKLWGLRKIDAPAAWSTVREGGKVLVAVIDTGVDHQHPDLKDNMWTNVRELQGRPGVDDDKNGYIDDIHGYDFYEDDGDPMDENDHGTHCAGTIAGVGENQFGVVGVNWKAQVMALRFLGPNGGNTIGAIKCIDYAVKQGAHVLSCSWGGGPRSKELEAAINRAEQRGVLMVVAAGNTNSDNDRIPAFPASFENSNIIAVGAIDEEDRRAGFSHYGRKSVDIGAPGVSILSTVGGGDFGSMSGTSMAAPHVSGAAVLTWATQFPEPKQDPQQMLAVRRLLLKNARGVEDLSGFWGQDSKVPGGVLNIGFLSASEEPPAPPARPSVYPVLVSAQFAYGQHRVSASKTLAAVDIRLPQPSTVHIVANTSVVADRGARLLTGFSDRPSLNDAWDQSMRVVEVPQRGRWVNFGSTVSVDLPAGQHTLRWKVMVKDVNLLFDAGSMVVRAVPRTPPGR